MSDKMTAEEAQQFEGFSASNAAILAQAAESHGCSCAAYSDWYTYRRWQAQGFQVQKGEHGVKLSTFIPTYATDENGDKVQTGKRPWGYTAFCRCQVKPIEKKEQH